MRKVVSTIAMIVFALSPSGLLAQDLAAMCENFDAPADGNWAEYSAEGSGQQGNIRFAILAGGDGEGRVLELNVSDAGGQSMILQVDIPGYPFDAADVGQIVMKAPGQPAMILPSSMVPMDNMALPVPDAQDCAEAEFLGMEAIEVAGVSYETYHLRPANEANAEVWLTDDVPFGIVKATSSDGVMMLLDHGTGATSSITETPISIPGM